MAKGDRERRKGERISTTLPVDLGDAKGITRNVSATGIYFETYVQYALGDLVRFTVELTSPGGPLLLKGSGDIVRIEPRGQQLGVAVKILESTMGSAAGPSL